jgi:hypothetical protein
MINKWTLGLAAVGAVSLASVAQAEEKLSAIQSALSATTISGYVDTSFEWQLKPDKESTGVSGSGPWGSFIPFRGENKRDGFNLNVVKLTFEKPLDEGEWASGYRVDLLAGPDAVGFNTSVLSSSSSPANSDFGIKQAYVALRTPVGNGIDWKLGVFDTIIGYESFESGNNPNFTRSFAWSVEPTQHTGILGTYKFNDMVSVSAGIANTHSAGINNRNTDNTDSNGNFDSFWRKTWMASVAVTLPESAGAMQGSTFYAGIVDGWSGVLGSDDTGGLSSEDQFNFYLGATLATPVTNLKVGLAFDYVDNFLGLDGQDLWIVGGYASFQATEKLSIHGRAEWIDSKVPGSEISGYNLTGTLQYDLWANVISRLEVRWDEVNVDNSGSFGERHLGVYANVIYKF